MRGGGHAWQGGVHGKRWCVAGGMHCGGHVWQEACMAEGACVTGGHVWQEEACVPGEMATAADGTHPTGMHSCFNTAYNSSFGKVMFSQVSVILSRGVRYRYRGGRV